MTDARYNDTTSGYSEVRGSTVTAGDTFQGDLIQWIDHNLSNETRKALLYDALSCGNGTRVTPDDVTSGGGARDINNPDVEHLETTPIRSYYTVPGTDCSGCYGIVRITTKWRRPLANGGYDEWYKNTEPAMTTPESGPECCHVWTSRFMS